MTQPASSHCYGLKIRRKSLIPFPISRWDSGSDDVLNKGWMLYCLLQMLPASSESTSCYSIYIFCLQFHISNFQYFSGHCKIPLPVFRCSAGLIIHRFKRIHLLLSTDSASAPVIISPVVVTTALMKCIHLTGEDIPQSSCLLQTWTLSPPLADYPLTFAGCLASISGCTLLLQTSRNDGKCLKAAQLERCSVSKCYA